MFSMLGMAAYAAASFASAGANAGSPGTTGFELQIVGTVPVVCRAELSSSIVATGGGNVSLGQMTEFCNNPNGYQIYAEGSSELRDAVLIMDGVEVPLSEGATLVSASSTAAIASRTVELRMAEGQAGGSLSFRIVAL